MDLGISGNVTDQWFDRNTASARMVQVAPGSGPGAWSNSLAVQLFLQLINHPTRRHDLAFSDFAPLFAATPSGPSGAHDALAAQVTGSATANGRAKVLDAQFGNGTQAGSIVYGALIGGKSPANQQTYPDIRYAFTHLGLLDDPAEGPGHTRNTTPNNAPTVDKLSAHQNHFHIVLQPPELRSLTANLLAQASASTVAESAVQLKPKKITPYIVRRVEQLTGQLCDEVENPSSTKKIGDTDGTTSPAMAVGLALKNRLGVEPVGRMVTNLVEPPKRGQIQHHSWVEASRSLPHAQFQLFKYTPEPNFYGRDKVKFEVAVNGKIFRVTMTILVVETHTEPPCQGVVATGEVLSAPAVAWQAESVDELVPIGPGDLLDWSASAQPLSFRVAQRFCRSCGGAELIPAGRSRAAAFA